MGAGSSTEQRSPEQPEAGSSTPAEPQPSGGGPAAEAAPGAPGDPSIAAPDPATKLLQKNGQLSTVNGLAEQGELGLQEEALNGQEEEVVVIDVGQRESEDVSERDSDKEMAANSAVVQDITKDGQEEMPEIIEQIPPSESNLEELTQPAESQTNDVGFKKVFKFVGFKFTVKKDKSEKSDTVQLLTVRKDDGEGAGESDGAGDHQDPSQETGEAIPKESELKKSTEKPEETLKHEQSSTEISLQAESGQAAEEGKDGEEKQEKEPTTSPDSPTSPMASETASPFKKFFTQGWAGWRKKTSFRRPKEDELDASEKKKEQEPERVGTDENKKTDDTSEKLGASEQPHPQETTESVNNARLSAEYEKVELPSEGQMQGSPEEKFAPLATEVFDEKVEIVAEVHVSTIEKKTGEPKTEVGEMEESLLSEKLVETNAELQEGEPAKELVKTKAVCAPGGDHTQPSEPSPDDKALSTHPEGIVSEVEMLSSQEKVKVQGSPLKKLFTSTGLKKLSGKKQKVKRGGGDEESGEHHPVAAESPDSTDEQKGESSASSPEEPEEITCLEKGIVDAHQEEEVEEGTTSDGEKKREGVTPWASFKKMVTPKKRVRRLSESDKEDELDKVKSATLSSTESAASETQEEVKGHGEEQKPEEPKRKVDTSVSWEALICVGSSKKRARKASSSDEEGGPKPMGGESQKPDEAGKDKEARPDTIPASSQEHDQGQGSSSPEQAGSPSEGEGVSTWESFKRLVTARKKSKSKLEEKNEDSGTGIEHSASDIEPGKEESWVSIKKFIPGRRKKRSDGKQEQAAIEDTGPTEINEDDSDVPAVVPLSEYDAVEREKMEAQEAKKNEKSQMVSVSEELSKGLVHTVTVAVIDGARALPDIEERSPSWISASVTEPPEPAEDEAKPPTGEVFEREVIAEETPVVTKTLPESQDAGDDTIISEVELTSEAVTAAETTEAFCAEEATEASGAEETTDMVSAVSQLTDSPDTTEEATPVQEVEGSVPDMEDQERRTQEFLQAVAEKVREESQLPDTRRPEDTVQPMPKVESKILEKVEEAEEDSQLLYLKKEMDVVVKVYAEETETENLTQGKVIVQAAPDCFEKVPQVTEGIESIELITTCQAETLAGVKSEIVLEQAVAPDSAETLTDSETNGSTPVADFEALHITQEDKIMEIHEDNEIASVTQPQVTEAEAVPALKEMPPAAPSGFQSQEENIKHSKMDDVLEHTDKEISMDTVPILSKAEVIQEAGQFPSGEEIKDGPFLEGLEVSADTEIRVSQKEIIEDARKDEVTLVTLEADFQKNDIELQSHTQSLPTPVDREMIVQVEREEMEAKPTPVNEEKLEQTPAEEELSKQLVQTVHVTILDGGKEVTRLHESSQLVQEEVICTEIQVQSSEASLPLIAAAVEETVLGETVKILGTAAPLESARAHLEPEEKSSAEDEDLTAQRGDVAVPTGTESQAEATPAGVSATPGKGIGADLEGDETTFQKGEAGEDHEQVSCQEVIVSETREEDFKAEKEILKLKTESHKLVQNVIQTVVDQLVSPEETATDCQTPAQLIKADSQKAGQKVEKEEGELQASLGDETQTAAAEESTLTTMEHSDISKDVNGAAEETMTNEVKSASINDQQLKVVVPSIQEEREATGTKSVLEGDDCAGLGERIEKSLSGSQEDERGDTIDDPETQTSALENAEPLTKESPDANGPKLQAVEFQDAEGHSESGKEIKTQTQEETQKRDREAATSEMTES
ncbi:A-kinase anchoring protein 12 [Rhinolophus ferrumequinum]|uniref:A-kinase anchoring protein 12 n=1 Tax=Rhinolophus ferrumequinum TaxID=59479 RepID=A0A7J7YPQ2_RHIFE|nr:A-kinase anchoring protein 12 [Rhinolophus ferrumequinum]